MTENAREAALFQFGRLIDIMDRLRGPDGCEWDKAQDFQSIAPYTLEEAFEVADAIARNNLPDLCDELGDLLLQVVFHARMASEIDAFRLADVAKAISDKMERRHPHIFSKDQKKLTAQEVKSNWEKIKSKEKKRESVLDGVTLGLPALTRALKISNKVAKVGFDWPDTTGPLNKIHEELAEIASATDRDNLKEEVGDLLFAVVNYARKLDVDPEEALRSANRKFENRFRIIEKAPNFLQLSLEEKEALWQQAKKQK